MSRPWSYSRLSTYEGCPKSYWYSYIEKLPSFRPESPAASRGTLVHEAAEAYLRGGMMYPKELQKVAGHAMSLKALKAEPEREFGVTDKWEPCAYDAPEAYFRGKLDVTFMKGVELHIQDWKTGQVYPEHPTQLERYVVLAAPHYPEAEKYVTRLVYTDLGVVTPPKVTAKDKLQGIRILLDARIQTAEADTIWPETPSPSACRWCEYHAKHGGPCTKGK